MQPRQNDLIVCHTIRGRLRLKARSPRSVAHRSQALAEWLSGQAGVIRADIRPVTGSIILFYDPGKTGTGALVALVIRALDVVSATDPRPAALTKPQAGQGSSLGRLLWFIGVSGVFAISVAQRLFFKSLPFQGLIGPSALLGAVPLVRRALHDIREHRGLTLFPFLAGTCILGVFMGEALTALEVIWVTELSMLLEDYVTDRSRRAIRQTVQVATKTTYILEDGAEVEVPAERVGPGNMVVVHTGERIPVDGTVAEGEAAVDEAHITGRAEAELRKTGDMVYAGTIVRQGMVIIRAERVGEDTYLGRVLRLVEESLANRAPAERRADALAGRLTAFGALAVVGTFLFTGQFVRAFTVLLVVACPCATVLAAGTAVTAALATAARKRSLVKGGLYLEKIGKADTFCFDKTGTLTVETPQVALVLDRTPSRDPVRVMALAASAELHNPHPVARAIVEEAGRLGCVPASHGVSEFALGKGVRTRVGPDSILVGNAEFMRETGIDVGYFQGRAGKLAETGHTVVFVAKNNTVQGMIAVTNPIRPDAQPLVSWLRTDGISSLHLVTGDGEPVARAVAETLGLDHYAAQLLPEEKARYVEKLRAEGRCVVMVGDGVNDALALSRADVSVAMGAGGAEAAIEASDIALVTSDLAGIATLRQLSHQTLRVIEQNFWLAVSTNAVGIALGAAGRISPITAGLIHVLHTLGIMVNSSRLLKWEPVVTPPSSDTRPGRGDGLP
ncbi:MAG: cation-translocating P-type ATPase [Syntrophorhabdales bacterium]|jgi:cation-transporting P-type ATPase C